MEKDLTQSYLRSLFEYNPKTGELLNKRTRGRARSGKTAGCTCSRRGYSLLGIDSKVYSTHRVIWFIQFGYWPNEIDHINGIRNDNRLENLREVTARENSKNTAMRYDNTSGVVGVTWTRDRGKWKAQTYINGKNRLVGYFDDLDEAAEAVARVRRENGYTERHGQPAKKNG